MPKNKKTQVAVKQSKAVAKKGKNKEVALDWGSVTSKENQSLQALCMAVSKVYGVPPLGVNTLAGQPYLNKEGRLYLLHDIRKGKEALKTSKTEYLQMSRTADEASICKVTLIFKDGLEVEGIGEASNKSVKLDAVKNTLNMMAETRAFNRAIWKAIGGSIWDRVEINLKKQKIATDSLVAEKLLDAGKVSYEEMEGQTKGKKPAEGQEMTTAEKFQKAKIMIQGLGSKSAVRRAMEMIRESELYDEVQKDNLMKELLVRELQVK